MLWNIVISQPLRCSDGGDTGPSLMVTSLNFWYIPVMEDAIIVMKKGKVMEQGTHAELIGRGGMYYDLVTKARGPCPPVYQSPITVYSEP